MKPDELLADIRAQLSQRADPQFRESMRRFSREPVDPYGVSAPRLKRMAAELYREVKQWPLPQRNKLCGALWQGKDEEGSLAVYLYQRFHRQCGACEFQLFEKWIDRYVDNWGHCDGVAHYLLSASIGNDPALANRLPVWTASPNRWKRRAAAVALVHEARAGRATGVILEVAGRLLEDPDDLVQKAVGWLLKEAYANQSRAVMQFLKTNGTRAPRLVLRIAAEKMPPGARARVLASGKA